MSGFLIGGAIACSAGALLKSFGSWANEEAQFLRKTKRMTLEEIADTLRDSPPGTRIYAATEGLTTAKKDLILSSDGTPVVYKRTTKNEVQRQWKWTEPRRRRDDGFWTSFESESKSVESNAQNAGLGLFSGMAAAFVDAGAENRAVRALEVPYSERFEAKQGANVVINNNNNGRRHRNRDRPPPPETLGFRKVRNFLRCHQSHVRAESNSFPFVVRACDPEPGARLRCWGLLSRYRCNFQPSPWKEHDCASASKSKCGLTRTGRVPNQHCQPDISLRSIIRCAVAVADVFISRRERTWEPVFPHWIWDCGPRDQ